MLETRIIEKYFTEFLINNPFAFVEFFSGYIPIIFCIIYFKSTWANYKVLVFYSIAILLLEVVGGLFSAIRKPNHIVYLIFYFFETAFLVYFYYNSFSSKKYKLIVITTLTIIILALFYNIFYGIGLMDNYSGSIQSIGFITISLICFYLILSNTNNLILSKSTLFLVNTGNIIYFSGRFFICLFILDIVLENNTTELDSFWYIVSVLLLIQRIFLAIGVSQTKNLITK